MKKSLSILPLTTALILTACSSDSTPPVDTEAAVATSTAYDLQTEVQSTAMPSSMMASGASYQQPKPVSYQQPQSINYSQPQPVSYQPSQPVYNPPATSTANYVPQPASVSSAARGNSLIPRDSEGKPIYSQMTKGSYTGDTYTVQKGDTMYLIGFISGKGTNEIARLNNLHEPYQLRVGQTLRLK